VVLAEPIQYLGFVGPPHQVSKHEVVLGLKLPPPEEGFETGVQLLEVKRLHPVVVGPQPQACQAVVERVADRDEKYPSRQVIGLPCAH
jgi:hypothetical protein